MHTDVDTVAALLAAAGLTVPEDEIERLAGLYPALRHSMDKLYRVDTGDEVQAAVFRSGDLGAGSAGGGR